MTNPTITRLRQLSLTAKKLIELYGATQAARDQMSAAGQDFSETFAAAESSFYNMYEDVNNMFLNVYAEATKDMDDYDNRVFYLLVYCDVQNSKGHKL